MSSSKGRTIKIFLVDGTPNGLLTAEIMNWTGHVITGPRSRLGELIQRPEARSTGVYFLIGPDAGTGLGTQVYIGETDDVPTRLKDHNRPEKPDGSGGKDFWERVCVVTSKDANLTKGHVKYLESRLIRIAQSAGRCQQLNRTDPGYGLLPEADRADMEFFLEQIQTLLPVLGYEFLREPPKPLAAADAAAAAGSASTASPVFVCQVKKHDIRALGQEIDGEFVVLAGSSARVAWDGADDGYQRLFNELVRAGVLALADDGKHRTFTRDHVFSSPSAAAAVVSGRSANGRVQWVTEAGGQTYGGWQEERVNLAAGRPALGEQLLAELEAGPGPLKN